MKHIIYILTLLLTTSVMAQKKEVTLVKEVKLNLTCEEGTAQALKDFASKEYKLISYGLLIAEDWEFNKFHWQYMKDKYGITMGNGGCIVDDAKLCYYNKMRALILKEFGEDIFEKGKAEAEALYKKD